VVQSSCNGCVGVGLADAVGVRVGDEVALGEADDVGVRLAVLAGVEVAVDVVVGVGGSPFDRSSAQPISKAATNETVTTHGIVGGIGTAT
jgi:hypothetical protein